MPPEAPVFADVDRVKAEVVPLRPILVDRRTMAGLLSVSERTLQSITQTGAFPCVRLGGRVLYSPAAAQDWIAKNQTRKEKPRARAATHIARGRKKTSCTE